jgi:hypothetical protein
MVWTKLITTLNVCGVLLTVPTGAVGVYTTYRANFSSDVTCWPSLRTPARMAIRRRPGRW